MISVVAYSLVEECPSDLMFFFRLRGWTEIILMLLIFTATIFYSLELGMALGIGLSVIILIRHATQPRIQILGKVPGTPTRFDNAELHPENVELVEGALIVKVPEPLTFANTGDLKNRLRRLELYGSSRAHPSLPRMRAPEHNKNIIFDVHGVTSIDGSGTQVLSEIVHAYAEQHVRVFFCRLPNSNVFSMFERSGIVEQCGGLSHFVPSVDEALQLAETEDQTQEI
jgi:MFS superfamily sulfate permease-like transporter